MEGFDSEVSNLEMRMRDGCSSTFEGVQVEVCASGVLSFSHKRRPVEVGCAEVDRGLAAGPLLLRILRLSFTWKRLCYQVSV